VIRSLSRFLTGLRVAAPLSDGELLQQFVAQRDESAFEALVRRHGPMVLRVCRKHLPNQEDAEDAFQATFIVLVRKAGSVAHESLASWLYGVACRIAMKTRTTAGRRGSHEHQAGQQAAAAHHPSEDSLPGDHEEQRSLIAEELQHLPAKYREPLVLCYLQGKTNQEAAIQLGWPMGTVATRLSHARDLLRQRLTKRGLTLSSAALAGLSLEGTLVAALPSALVTATVEGSLKLLAGAPIGQQLSPRAIAWADAASRGGASTRSRLVAALCIGLGSLGLFAYLVSGSTVTPPPGGQPGPTPQVVAPVDLPGHKGTVQCVAVAPDASFVASGGADATVKIWPSDTGKVRQSLPLGDPVYALAISPDSRLLGVGAGKQLYLYEMPAGKMRFKVGLPALVNSLAFSPDSLTLEAGTGRFDGPLDQLNAAYTYDARTGNRTSGELHKRRGYTVNFNALGRLNALAPDTLMPPTGPKEQAKIFEKVVFCTLAVTKDGKRSAWTISNPDAKRGHLVFMGDYSTGKIGQSVFGPTSVPIRALTFSPDDRLLAAAGDRVTVWDMATFRALHRLPVGAPVHALSFSADGQVLAVAVGNKIQVWDLKTNQVQRTLEGEPSGQ
jgi:RNA polymerase sigma factor (sigma-70 family)